MSTGSPVIIPSVPESDKPFYLAIIASVLTGAVGLVLIVHPASIDASQAGNVFAFFSGLMALSWGHYFGKSS